MSQSTGSSTAARRLKLIAGVLVVIIAITATWIIARATAPSSQESGSGASNTAESHSDGESASEDQSDSDGSTGITESDLKSLGSGAEEIVMDEGKSQLTYVRLSDGMHLGTANEKLARPALSLSKLYIAEYVLAEGSEEEKFQALNMISTSSDDIAEDLFEAYPESIDEVAAEYGLESTESANHWGNSVTSAYDIVKFIAAIKDENPTHPILVAMSQPDEIAADGYDQDFGTADMNNVIGTKWGWSNNRQVHSSVSFGHNFIVAASVNGSARDLTRLVRTQVSGSKLKEATTWFLDDPNAEPSELLPGETFIIE